MLQTSKVGIIIPTSMERRPDKVLGAVRWSAYDRSLRKSMGESFVQQWTSYSNDNDKDTNVVYVVTWYLLYLRQNSVTSLL